jgi:hypothetical protein
MDSEEVASTMNMMPEHLKDGAKTKFKQVSISTTFYKKLWVRYLRSNILRPTGFLDIKADKKRGVRRPNFTRGY